MPYVSTHLNMHLMIRELYSVHYFEYSSSYRFVGESHDFWEFLYVDKGTVLVTAGERQYSLSKGQIIFHEPGEFHALAADGVAAPNLVVISFGCDSPAMEYFRRHITCVGAPERALLARIIEESSRTFSTPLNDPTTTELVVNQDGLVGGEQMIANALEELLLRLIRKGVSAEGTTSLLPQQTNMMVLSVIEYLGRRMDQTLTVSRICRDNMIGRSQLQKLFHEHTGGGVMEYFNEMKIQTARRMIREGMLNTTQISEALGFCSVHYFSRRFKDLTGMSPREYADSVKMLAQAADDLNEYVGDEAAQMYPGDAKA